MRPTSPTENGGKLLCNIKPLRVSPFYISLRFPSIVVLHRLNVALGLAGFFRHAADGGADLFDFGVAEFDGFEHLVFRDLFGPGFNHHDAFGGTDHHNIELALTRLLIGGAGNELSVD